eukprot:gene3041-5051_t
MQTKDSSNKKEATVFHSTTYDQYHQIRKENSESWDKIISYVNNSLANFEKTQQLNYLSVGCGDGESDLKILKKLGKVNFYGIDVDSKPLERFETEIKKLKNVEFKLVNNYFNYSFVDDCLCKDKKFDFIFFLHVIHLFPSPTEAIKNAIKLLNPNGFIHVAIHVYYPGVPQLVDELYDGVSFGQKKFFTAETLQEEIKDMNYKSELLGSKVDVTDAIEKKESGLNMFSFMLSMRTPEEKDIEVLKKHSYLENNRWYLKEPVMMFKIYK